MVLMLIGEIEHEYCWQCTAIELLQKAAEAILCTLFECSVMAMAHYKHIMVNADNMKLVLGISTMTGLNYFGLIDVPDHPAPAPAAIICCLCSAPASPTTPAAAPPPLSLPTTASLPPPGADRVSACQIVGIRAPVQFTKLVLEEQEEEKKKKEEEKKKKEEEKERKKKKEREKEEEKENDDNNENDNDDEDDADDEDDDDDKNDELAI
ncbi:hypothetical protein CPC735_036480 [Coccidioides posadasii C735 delta SOWgp]|uniref:Histone H3 n=1 Tax=Coccidioides posadasii (strain C735) TaxID=222929 RepID=C5P239_COCP7|nr:hypothetical protein CPC735_036480 [Coccidioides posadasii C735 delta SOWgp]EER28942.1 hypothetical protein CPC735_036480 [Coccidioides posadasii C735 delta SOWgp]|eukprot:XP_003071087.1 hypothetical protein CPC735_036480 [Coccidioides posadasii C735 delta SOWgp]